MSETDTWGSCIVCVMCKIKHIQIRIDISTFNYRKLLGRPQKANSNLSTTNTKLCSLTIGSISEKLLTWDQEGDWPVSIVLLREKRLHKGPPEVLLPKETGWVKIQQFISEGAGKICLILKLVVCNLLKYI